MSDFGSQIIYKALLERHHHIEVPMIQRDYAQGRESEKEVRDEFLDALHAALILPEDNESLPLNLDFIYGSVEGDGVTRFLPLDGQQRLTTLFLLHWYLSWRDGCWDEFKQMFCQAGASRFYYSVRPSSTEFFDALVRFEPMCLPEDVVSLSEMLTDQPWYFRYWRLDPTIQSSLTMLNAIHLRFKDSNGLFARITSFEKPAITFQLLDLENFGLSDDLYIKMNARGKPLTPFETFKARFGQELKRIFGDETRSIGTQECKVAEFFSHRMDTQWADFFWPHRNPGTNVFDDAVMNLFRTVILITRFPETESFVDDITLLRNKSQKSTYSLFHRRGWVDRAFSEMLIILLDAWSGNGEGIVSQLPNSKYFDEEAIFSKVVNDPASIGYEELVQLAGYALFIRKNEVNICPTQFQEWMRIVVNLSVNTEYNRPADMQRSIAGLLNMATNMTDILKHFANVEKPAVGFSMQQVSEEKLKAQLIVAQPEWRSLIDEAEGHGYFRGQIEFLLDFSGIIKTANLGSVAEWDDITHQKLQKHFSDFLQKAKGMFTDKGLKELPDFRWERALLCIGDYLLPRGRNHSFLVNAPADQASWKRLLRGLWQNVSESRNLLGELWSRLNVNKDLTEQLDAIITETNNLEAWRDAFVQTPAAIRYCYQRLMRREYNGELYLLQTTQMNGTHAELFTYCFYKNTLTTLCSTGCLKHTQLLSYYDSINTEFEPGIMINFPYDNNWLRFEIEHHKNQYIIFIHNDKVAPYPLVEVELHERLGFTKTVTRFIKEAPHDLIQASIIELADNLAAIPTPEKNNV